MDLKDAVVVEVDVREPGSSNRAKRLRRDGKLPAVLYGEGRPARTVTCSPREVVEILRSEHGQNSILTLKVADGRKQTAMVHDYAVDPISRKLLHVDFKRIDLKVAVEVNVPIELAGESRGVKLDSGILDQVIREVLVRCLPTVIPDSLVVDVSDLGIGDAVHISDLHAADGVEILGDPDQTVATVAPPTVIEVETEEEEEDLLGAAPEPELIGGKGVSDEEDES